MKYSLARSKGAVPLSVRRPKLVIALWLLVVVAAVPFALQLDGALSSGGFVDPRAEAVIAQQLVHKSFGDSPNQIVVVLDSDRSIPVERTHAVIAELRRQGAVTVRSNLDDPAWQSASRETALFVAGWDGSASAVQNRVPAIQEGVNLEAGSGVRAYVTGQPALDYQLNAHSKEDATRAELVVFPILIIVLLIVFRSVAAAIIPLLIAGGSLAIASGTGFVATQFMDVSNLYSNILSMIGLAVAIDYSLFVIKRYREELVRGRDVESAIVIAMRTAGRSVMFSGLAVALALSALFLPGVMVFNSIGLGGIVVTLVALLITLSALPAVLRLLGPRINWGTVTLPVRWSIRRREYGLSTRLPFSRPKTTAAIVVTCMLALAVPIAGISLQSPVASANVLPAHDSARQGLEILQRKIGDVGLFPIDVVLTADAGVSSADLISDVAAATSYVSRQSGVRDVTSVATLGIPDSQLVAAVDRPIPSSAPMRALWDTTHRDTVTRILVNTNEGPDSVRAHELVEQFRSGLSTHLGDGVSATVTGATAQGLDFDQTLIRSIPLIALFVFLFTFVMLVFAFRAVLLPLLAIGFNVLVVFASLGMLTAFVSLTQTAPINSVTPLLLFSVMFGLSMDYMVIIMSRIREFYVGGVSFSDAVRRGLHQTRSMVNSAALIMVAVFASFATAQISVVREIGIGLAIAVALDALLIRTFVMPSVLMVVGPRVLGKRALSAHSVVKQDSAQLAKISPELVTVRGDPAFRE